MPGVVAGRSVLGPSARFVRGGSSMKLVHVLMAALAVLALSARGTPAQEFPKPGPQQELLKQMAGVLDGQVKCLVPGKGLQESKGVLKSKLDVGGFFLVTEFKGELAGQPFQGRGITGYDPFKK